MLCRICLLQNPSYMEIFDDVGKQLNIAEVVQKHLWFKPQADDGFTTKICTVCWHKIDDFNSFYGTVEKAHKEYEQTVVAGIKVEVQYSSPVQLEKDNDNTFIEPKCEWEINNPFDENEKYDNYEPTYFSGVDPSIDKESINKNSEAIEKNIQQKTFQKNVDGAVHIKLERYSPIKLEQDNEELINSSDNTLVETKCEWQVKNSFAANCSENFIDKDDGRFSDDYELSNFSKEEPSTDDELLNKYSKNSQKNIPAELKDETFPKQQKTLQKKKRVFKRLDKKKSEEMIKKYIPMGCNLCIFVGTAFSDIVQHFKTVHPEVRPYIMCCDKKFSNHFFVAQHAMQHEDPNYFSCKECNKSFSGTSGLRWHNLNFHAPKEDLIYGCESCPKKFARSNLLELHTPSHIPREQWQFICSKCPDERKFASNYLLNNHVSMIHNREINICPVCAKNMKDKRSYEKHVRLHFEDSGPRVKCPYADCDSWLKDEDNLKKHLIRHNPEGKIYKCDECGKECTNRRALTNHKTYTHSTQVYQCEYCDKKYKKPISLREHMAKHTGETLYKCPFCTKTFNSKANMHGHKKKQHPIQWEEWRRNKQGSTEKSTLEQIGDANLSNTLNK